VAIVRDVSISITEYFEIKEGSNIFRSDPPKIESSPRRQFISKNFLFGAILDRYAQLFSPSATGVCYPNITCVLLAMRFLLLFSATKIQTAVDLK